MVYVFNDSQPPLFAAILVLALHSTAPAAQAQKNAAVAPSPPLGWNSWDAYGLTIDEADYRANAAVLAGMQAVRLDYSVIDEGWYMQDPFGKDVAANKYSGTPMAS